MLFQVVWAIGNVRGYAATGDRKLYLASWRSSNAKLHADYAFLRANAGVIPGYRPLLELEIHRLDGVVAQLNSDIAAMDAHDRHVKKLLKKTRLSRILPPLQALIDVSAAGVESAADGFRRAQERGTFLMLSLGIGGCARRREPAYRGTSAGSNRGTSSRRP